MLSAVSNTLLKGNYPPIQAQVIDAQTCFDNIWLESCMHSIKEGNYPSFTIQPYLRGKQISNKEKVYLTFLDQSVTHLN